MKTIFYFVLIFFLFGGGSVFSGGSIFGEESVFEKNSRIVSIFVMPANANVEKEIKKKKIEKKINELKIKEKVEIKRLTKSQKNLEKTTKTIKTCKNKLWKSRINISRLESKLNSFNREYEILAYSTGQKIREIYKGERVCFLDVLFASKDIPTFFDRLYYQRVILKKDKELMDKLKQKSIEIIRSQRSVEYEKKNIASTLNTMSRKKKQINYSIQTSEYLISKLRTDREAYEQAQRELEHLSRDIEKGIVKIVSTETIIDSVFIRPIAGVITSGFGWRRHPIFKGRRFHSGVDIAGPNRTPIKASNSGKIIHSGWYGGYGKVIIINHGIMQDGLYKGKKISTLYAHMSRTAVKVGTYIRKGQIVGYEGSTGYSTGPHLHFEVRVNGKPINPIKFIRR